MQVINALTINVDDAILLEALDEKHAAQLLNLVNNNREHLRAWLPWVDYMHTEIDFKNFIVAAQKRQMAGSELSFVVIVGNSVAGRIGIYNIDQNNKIGSIGYWLGKGFEGRGVISKASKEVIRHGFNALKLNRIEIRCGIGNQRSKAVPERLHFTNEGTIRQGEFVNSTYIDLA